MPSTEIKSQIAFKNLLGKSMTNDLARVVGENNGYLLTVPTTNVWSTPIPEDPTDAITNNIAFLLTANLVQIDDSKSNGLYLAYQAVWGDLPSTVDPKTGSPFAYGQGSLVGISLGSKVRDFIPSSFGKLYEVKPYKGAVTDANEIFQLDDRDWIFQYNSGIFFQSNVTYAGYTVPQKVVGYYYLGNKLSTLDSAAAEVIRVSASGPNGSGLYTGPASPVITSLSKNHLYLVNFENSNTTNVTLNISSIGPFKVLKYGTDGPIELSSNDIQGGNETNPGPTYYLTWNPPVGIDPGYFLFYESNPSQTPGLYKNESQVITKVGGIEPLTSFNDVSLQDMFTDLLYPEQVGNLTSFNIQNNNISYNSPGHYMIEVGRTLTGTLTFSWTSTLDNDFSPITVDIKDVTSVISPNTNWPASGTGTTSNITSVNATFSYPNPMFVNSPDTRVYTITGTRQNKTLIRKRTDINWTWRTYYGSSISQTITPLGLTSLTSQLMTQSVGTLTMTGSVGYKYFAFPNDNNYSFKNISYVGFPVLLATSSYNLIDNGHNYTTMSVTNSFGINKEYRVYRTLNQINGTLSVNITN
jgi:hypothetical protein